MSVRSAVIVMAKAPVPGFAKTRLIPALGTEGSARLAKALLDRAVKQALAAHLGEVHLCCTPDTEHAAFVALNRLSGVTLAAQGDGDLGQRMARAFERVLTPGGRALITGTDAPALNAATLRQAAEVLDHHDAVLIPAHDGGYTLLGLRVAASSLFEGVAWSTASVLDQTRDRLKAAKLTWLELPALHDIDEPADLVHLPPELMAGLPT
jgi:uncharacterized protein